MPLRSPMALAVLALGRLPAPPDAWAAGPGFPGTVAEIVTFRLLPGTDEPGFWPMRGPPIGLLPCSPAFCAAVSAATGPGCGRITSNGPIWRRRRLRQRP